MAAVEHRTAAAIAEAALSTVFGASAVQALREDSPLSAVGLAPADLVCISDAVSDEAVRRGLTCVLDDADLGTVTTVGDLVGVVQAQAVTPQDRG